VVVKRQHDVFEGDSSVKVAVAVAEGCIFVEVSPLRNALAETLAGKQVVEKHLPEAVEVRHQLVVFYYGCLLVCKRDSLACERDEQWSQSQPQILVSEHAVLLRVEALEKEEHLLICDFECQALLIE